MHPIRHIQFLIAHMFLCLLSISSPIHNCCKFRFARHQEIDLLFTTSNITLLNMTFFSMHPYSLVTCGENDGDAKSKIDYTQISTAMFTFTLRSAYMICSYELTLSTTNAIIRHLLIYIGFMSEAYFEFSQNKGFHSTSPVKSNNLIFIANLTLEMKGLISSTL